MPIFRSAALLLFATLLFSAPAHAYLDAGTGSMILQTLLAAIAGAVTVARFYGARIRQFWRGMRGGAAAVELNDPQVDEAESGREE